MFAARISDESENNLPQSSSQSSPDATEMKEWSVAAEPSSATDSTTTFSDLGLEVSANSRTIIATVIVAILLIASGVFLLTSSSESNQSSQVLPTPSPDPVVCTTDVFECADGSFVSRDPQNDCKFEACPDGVEATPSPSPSAVTSPRPTTQPTQVPSIVPTVQPTTQPTPSPTQPLANIVMENVQCNYRVAGYEPAPATPGTPQQYQPNLFDGMTITIPSEYKDAEKKMYCRYTFQNIEDVQTGVVHERHIVNGETVHTGEHPPLNKGEGRSSYRIYDMGTGQQSMQFEVNYKRTFEEENYSDNVYTISFTVVQQ